MRFDQETLISLLCAIPALVLGLTIHEFAHAWTAYRLGDPTPKRLGRVSLDPAVHIDPLGALFFCVAWFSGYGLGWAKPVPIVPRNLHHPRRDSMLVALAGPVSNMLQMPLWLAALWVFGRVAAHQGWSTDMSDGMSASAMFAEVLINGVYLNISLAAFNMVPLPPLDGHWVLQSIGGEPVERFFDQMRPYSFIILIGVINFTPLFGMLLGPIRDEAMRLAVWALYGLPT